MLAEDVRHMRRKGGKKLGGTIGGAGELKRREQRPGCLNRPKEMRACLIPLFLSFSFLYLSWPVVHVLLGR